MLVRSGSSGGGGGMATLRGLGLGERTEAILTAKGQEKREKWHGGGLGGKGSGAVAVAVSPAVPFSTL